MTEVIPIAFSAQWGVPVCLVQQNKMKWVRGPAEAVHCLRNDFAVQSGPAYNRALHVCFAALRFESELDVAKLFFVNAYEDQKMRLRDRT
jgi:hypothetical protein